MEMNPPQHTTSIKQSVRAQSVVPAEPSSVRKVLRSPGVPLEAATRAFMEPRFGHDLSRVRVHTDFAASDSARAVESLAYTVGQDIVFDAGRYAPRTEAGRKLLAHELAHVVQSSDQPVRAGQTMDTGPSSPSEIAAERAAREIASGATQGKVSPIAGPAPILQRYTVPGSLACGEMVDWLNSHSPYAPEWAETRCNYSFLGNVDVKTSKLPDGTIKADVKGNDKLGVSVDCPVDRPEWNPANRANRDAEVAAFHAMRVDLDKHENDHRKIGNAWRGKLETRYRAVNFSVTGKDQAAAMANAQANLDSQKQQWGADAQKAQDAIDPFRGAVLNCP